MSSPTASAVILVVEQTKSLTVPEEAVRRRLSERFKYTVHVQDAANFHLEEGTTLVVVCSRRAPHELLELATPALICNPSALFGVGMTTARRKDFGLIDYSSLLVCPDYAAHPLAAGLTGRHKITEERAYQGWAKPGAGARIVATVGGDSSRAVVFAYDKGESMPGCEAPARRVAFLAPGTQEILLTEQGWMLFDAAVRWAAEGGAEVESEGPAGHWFLKDGAPTRALSADEYRAWVHEQVSRQVWKSLFTVLSFIGIGGLVTLYLAFSSQLSSRVDDRITTRLRDTEKNLENKLEEKAASKVAQLVFETSPVAKQVVENLKKQADQIIKDQLESKDTRDKLVTLLVEELYQNGKITMSLLERFRNNKSESAELRRLILQLMLIYATPDQRSDMQKELLAVITDEREHEDVRKIALKMYQPGKDAEETNAVLRRILERLSGEAHPIRDPATAAAYATFLAHFTDNHAKVLFDWLAEEKARREDGNVGAPVATTQPTLLEKAILTGVTEMLPAGGRNPTSLTFLVNLAFDPGREPEKRWLAVKALEMLNPRPTPELDETARLTALDKFLGELASLPDDTKGLYERSFMLFTPLIVNRIVFALLRPQDEKFIRDNVSAMGKDAAKDRPMQVLLFNWVRRLEGEKKKVLPRQVIETVYLTREALYGDGTARMLEYAVRHGISEDVEKFLTNFSQLYQGAKYAGMRFKGGQALQAAVSADAKASSPHQATLNLLTAHKAGPGDESIRADLRDEVKKALATYCRSAARQPNEFTVLQNRLSAPGLKDDANVRAVLVPALTEAYTALVYRYSVTQNWPLVIDAYTQITQLNPADATYFYRRGKIYSERLDAFKEAGADFKKAIELFPAPKAAEQVRILRSYRENLGDLYLRWAGHAAQAAEQFEAALALFDPKDNSAVARRAKAELHRKLALACIQQNNRGGAVSYVEQAKPLFLSRLDRARNLENLGLLYLRAGEARLAFERSKDVLDLYPNLPWNQLVRYLTARKLGEHDEADKAYAAWQQLGGGESLVALYAYIPELLKEYLGVKRFEKGMLRTRGPRPQGKNESVHEFKMEAGKRYVIDMVSTAFDAYLIVKSPSGKVWEDDDRGGYPNARVTMQADQTGIYQIIATSYRPGVQGAYTLVIRDPKVPGR
jgi:tetratricopeptide (TPR) repeat protein